MGNLSDRLTNPMELAERVSAITTAVLLDEAASDSNLATNIAGGALGSVPAQSAPLTVSVLQAWPPPFPAVTTFIRSRRTWRPVPSTAPRALHFRP